MSISQRVVVARRCSRVLVACLFLALLAGCSHHPVRNLASDISLVKTGETTRKEVLSLLGDPDSTRMVSDDTEEWAYYEEQRSMWQNTPVVGGAFSSKGNQTVVLTLKGDIVTAARFGAFDKHELDWQNDYSWQKIEKKTDGKSSAK